MVALQVGLDEYVILSQSPLQPAWETNKGIEPEIIDLLHGRIRISVFVNHYYQPDINVS